MLPSNYSGQVLISICNWLDNHLSIPSSIKSLFLLSLSLTHALSKSQCNTLLDTFFPVIWDMLKNEVVSGVFLDLHLQCIDIWGTTNFFGSCDNFFYLVPSPSQDSGEICSMLKLCNSTSAKKMVCFLQKQALGAHTPLPPPPQTYCSSCQLHI